MLKLSDRRGVAVILPHISIIQLGRDCRYDVSVFLFHALKARK